LASPTERRRNSPSRIGAHTTFGGRRSVGADSENPPRLRASARALRIFPPTGPRGTRRSFRISDFQRFSIFILPPPCLGASVRDLPLRASGNTPRRPLLFSRFPLAPCAEICFTFRPPPSCP
jgi:hypothetical protein